MANGLFSSPFGGGATRDLINRVTNQAQQMMPNQQQNQPMMPHTQIPVQSNQPILNMTQRFQPNQFQSSSPNFQQNQMTFGSQSPTQNLGSSQSGQMQSKSGILPGKSLIPGLSSIFSYFFGNDPYGDAMDQYKQYADMAAKMQDPYYQAGLGGLGDLQKYLSGMSDPSGFINNLMGQYQESPYAKYEQDQAMKSAQNAASASGMLGSTPFLQQAQQQAEDISSKDMNEWLQNVLGINQQYGQGLSGLAGMGQHAADSMTQLYEALAQAMGEGAYGQAQAQNKGIGDIFSGIGSLFGL